jgi:hypothetical protein
LRGLRFPSRKKDHYPNLPLFTSSIGIVVRRDANFDEAMKYIITSSLVDWSFIAQFRHGSYVYMGSKNLLLLLLSIVIILELLTGTLLMI